MPSLLGNALVSSAAQMQHWKREIAQADFDPIRQFLPVEELRTIPKLAVRLRMSILLRTYRGDYHTDSFDIERLSQRILQGDERIVFWGEADAIDTVRAWVRDEYHPTTTEIDQLLLGTASILDATPEFGAGYAQMCRTGTTCASPTADAPILIDLLRLIEKQCHLPIGKYHTFFSVPRNRSSTREVRGGAAIHRFHTRRLGSSFWGIAPWYVMAGGNLEALDYRELYSQPEKVAASLQGRRFYLASESDARYLDALLQLNLEGWNERPVLEVSDATTDASCGLGWRLMPIAPHGLHVYQPLFIRPYRKGNDCVTACRLAESQQAACTVVLVPLEEPKLVSIQYALNQQGYHLAAFTPSKVKVQTRDIEQVETCCFGLWVRPNPLLSLVSPYYLTLPCQRAAERTILQHLSLLLTQWNEGRSATLCV